MPAVQVQESPGHSRRIPLLSTDSSSLPKSLPQLQVVDEPHNGGRGSLAVTSGEEQPSLVVAYDGAKPWNVACYDRNAVGHRLGTDAAEGLCERGVEHDIGLCISIAGVGYTTYELHLATSEVAALLPIAGSWVLARDAVAEDQPADGSPGTSVDSSHDVREQVESLVGAESTHVGNSDDVRIGGGARQTTPRDRVCRIDGIGDTMDLSTRGKATGDDDLFRDLGNGCVFLHRRKMAPECS